jgi:hypothetical protein
MEEFRDKLEKNCALCGRDKDYIQEFSKNSSTHCSWSEHVYRLHNMYEFIDLVIYLKGKSRSECDIVEMHLKNVIERDLKEDLVGLFSHPDVLPEDL